MEENKNKLPEAQSNVELTDEELEDVAGGRATSSTDTSFHTLKAKLPNGKNKKTVYISNSGGKSGFGSC